MPPVTLNNFLKPRVRSKLAIKLDLCPPAQVMAIGVSLGSSFIRCRTLFIGMCWAPAMNPLCVPKTSSVLRGSQNHVT